MNRTIRYSVIMVLLVAQSLFLGMIVKEKYQEHTWVSALVIFLVAVFLWVAYMKAPLHHHEHDVEDSLVAVWVPVGAVGCYCVSTQLQLGNVIGAGLTGTLGSFLPNMKKDSAYLSKLPPAIYCGAFVGMSSTSIAPSLGFILAAGTLAGVLLLYSKSLFLGVGGKLGTLAFASVVIVSFILYLFGK
ncbi:MAG: hypothetical protein QM610_15550 [Chitinophagaceae bacterium]